MYCTFGKEYLEYYKYSNYRIITIDLTLAPFQLIY